YSAETLSGCACLALLQAASVARVYLPRLRSALLEQPRVLRELATERGVGVKAARDIVAGRDPHARLDLRERIADWVCSSVSVDPPLGAAVEEAHEDALRVVQPAVAKELIEPPRRGAPRIALRPACEKLPGLVDERGCLFHEVDFTQRAGIERS